MMYIDNQGYMRFNIKVNDKVVTIHEHKLNALINNSLHDVFNKDNDVHHDDRCRLNNEPDNLVVMPKPEHMSLHKPSLETRQKMSEVKLNPCIRIRKYKDKSCKQGFRWFAQPYTKDGKIKLSSVDLNKCIKKVIDFKNSPLNTYGYTHYQVIGDD